MKRHRLQDQRGSVLLYTTLLLALLIGMGGLAIDLSYLAAARGELQRSMDAAALAGAGNLGFDDTVFPTARQEAWRFGNLNPYRGGTLGTIVNLNLNPANDPNGDIVLGIWDASANSFSPSLDGTRVNAVLCQYTTQIPTSFLRLLGATTLPVSARAIGVSYPPRTVSDTTCVFPIAVEGCGFDPGSSTGCGAPVNMITSSGTEAEPSPPGTNTAAWSNLCGTGVPSVPETLTSIQGASSGSCTACDPDGYPEKGDFIGTNNGMQQVVFDALAQEFMNQYDASCVDTASCPSVTDSAGVTTYEGPGWKVAVPVIGTDCPAQAITGPKEIIGWTEFLMTQVINRGTCVVSNTDPVAQPYCDNPTPAMRAVFGYYSCEVKDAPPDKDPGIRSALADRMRLVQ